MAFAPSSDGGLSCGTLKSRLPVRTLNGDRDVVKLNVFNNQASSGRGLRSGVVSRQETDFGIGDGAIDEHNRADTLTGAASVAHVKTSGAVVDGD